MVNCPQDKIRDTDLTIEQVDDLNEDIGELVANIVKDPYFSVYKVDLSQDRCPFVNRDGICGNHACAIEPIDEHLPEIWRSPYLGKLRDNSVSTVAPADSLEGCAPEEKSIYAYLGRVSDRHDYCYPEDESDEAKGVWVDLNDNIERFTGYSGEEAHRLWRAVYEENCFGYNGDDYATSTGTSLARVQPMAVADHSAMMSMFADSIERGGRGLDEKEQLPLINQDDQCVEQRLFYKLLSGMHASVSTHLSYDWLNTTSGYWGPNVGMFVERVGNHEDRLNHLYFNYVLVSRAVAKLANYFELLSFSTTCESVDTEVRRHLWRLSRRINKYPRGINETALFMTPEGRALKDEFRRRVRNVNALMSCVGCERCRLWGKMQTAGYGTSLKVLLELPERPEDDPVAVREVLSSFKRSELVALLNTFARISHSVESVGYFRRKVADKYGYSQSFSYQLKLGLKVFRKAVGFILQSYLDFPKNIWRFFLYYSHMYWNKFVGRTATLTHIDL